jgi:transposase
MITLLSELHLFRGLNMKPNFSELARKHNCDYRTVKKYYEGYEGKPKKRNKPSRLDIYYNEIKDKLSITGINKKAVYEYLIDKYDEIGTYSNFSKYVNKNKLNKKTILKDVSVRYETPPGKQAQVDWKEDVKIYSKHGEVFVINIFSYKLGSSRYCKFEYSEFKTRDDVFRCLINSFKFTGGVPKEILFDNMRSIVDLDGSKRKINNKVLQFSKDFGFKVRLCKPYTPKTKGKVESVNKFITWLLAYNKEFEDLDELIKIINNINLKVNTYINQTTNVSPTFLFQKEKEYLLPLPDKSIIESYLNTSKKYKVHKDSLITFKGKKYSVPSKFIDKYVIVKHIENELQIYYNSSLITKHLITNKIINYSEDHYKEILSMSIKDSESLENIINENLSLFDKLLKE